MVNTDISNQNVESMPENVELDEDNDALVIESGPLDPNRIQESLPEGRRIVDISFMWNEIHRTFDNHARGIECQFKDWKLIKSYRRGLMTQLFFKCQMCNYEDNFWSEPIEPERLDINTAAVAGTITMGIGYAQLEELCAAMNIPCMSEPTYFKYTENLIDDFTKTAMENMKMAGEAEKQLALERNDVIDGIPYITVVADGSWMKRSYGTAYNSLSGIGAIIGYYTKQLLFVGIRNKLCAKCEFYKQKGIEPIVHKCFKNHDRNASSTSMESDAIAEGFKCSLEMHGLIYKTVVADGDSSVYQAILDNRPYSEQMVTVKKIECTNHLLRNLCKKLKNVSEMTQSKLKGQRTGFVQLRNIIKSNILTIRKEVEKAAELRRKEQRPQHCKIIELQKDILNIPNHVFGEHKECEARGLMCKENGNEMEKNYIPYLKFHSLYQHIENAIMFISGYSDSLLLNLTNNPAESFNSIICKEIGGKRINFGKRGSYNARIAGAVVQYNTQQVLTELHKSMCKTVPPIVENLEKRPQIKVARTRESRKMQGRQKFKREPGTDRYYGPQSQKPDFPSNVLEQLKQSHEKKLFENGKNWQKIERDTRDQNESELWLALRREMLTASNFGTVCRMRLTTSCAAIVKNILYPSSIDTAAMKYGRENEKIAMKELAQKLNKEIKPCGLFIDIENPFLGASPDGLIEDNGLVEIKCPMSAENLTAEEAIDILPSLKVIFEKKIHIK